MHFENILWRSINMGQVLRDSHGRMLGTIEINGSKQIIRDEHGRYLGEFDGKITRDAHGRMIGQGNLLTTLLVK